LFLCASGQDFKADSLTRILRSVRTDTAKANAYNKLADYYKENNPDSTRFYARKAAALAAKTNYGYAAGNAEINQGNAEIIFGNYKTALLHFEKAQSIYETLLKADNDNLLKNGLARAYASAGVVNAEESNYYLALQQYQKALGLYRQTGQKQSISKAYNNIGIVYKSQQNDAKALEYFKKALQIQQEIGEQAAAVSMMNIGLIYFEAGNLPQAHYWYQKAGKRFETTNNRRGFALLKNYLGDYRKEKGDLAMARKYYQESVDMYESMQNEFGSSLGLYKIGQLLFEEKQYRQAIPYAEKSLVYAKNIGVLDQAYHSEKLLSDIYAALDRPDEAFTHYKNYVAARDSIDNQENSRKFTVAEMNFEYLKKEALMAEKHKRQRQFAIFAVLGAALFIGLVLLAYNRRLVKRRLTLQKEVAEYEQKALHLQMNPHFVFNCLSSISSFIVQNGTDQALKYLSKFSKLMRLTLEYSKDSLIPIDKEIESLRNYLELEQLRFSNKFKFNIQASDKIEFNMGLPPLLIQPFVENAILHGIVPKEENGWIEIYFDVQNQQLVCTITDNGIGLSQSTQLQPNPAPAHQSMALEITRKRLEIMESTTSKAAHIDIADREETEYQPGTKVTLRLPIQYIQ